MRIKQHPFWGLNKRLTPADNVVAYVESIGELPQKEMGDRVKPYWKEQQASGTLPLIKKGGKEVAAGVVPAGKYTDPDTKEAKVAVVGLYRHLKGQPISRHLVAVALNFQVSDDVDKVRDALKEEGNKDIDPGDRGRSVRWVGKGASWTPPVKAASEKKVTAKKAAAKAPAKAAAKAAAPKGTRPAKKAAEAEAKAEAKAAIAEAEAEVTEAPAAAAEEIPAAPVTEAPAAEAPAQS